MARDLKARYRGSVLGFFWSFVNPLLLLLVYTLVFTVVLPGVRPPELDPFALFMFCGILPWTWFSSSLLESSNVLIAGSNLIRKVLFPAGVVFKGSGFYVTDSRPSKPSTSGKKKGSGDKEPDSASNGAASKKEPAKAGAKNEG